MISRDFDQEVIQQLETVRDFLRWTASRFIKGDVYFGHGIDNALDEAFQLLQYSIGLPEGAEAEVMEAKLTISERSSLVELVKRRVESRIPLAYITHESWFAGLPFYVDERVLIPRSPIAELLQQGFAPWLKVDSVHQILDLCSGSGCIGIASAHYFEEATVDLLDVSAGAIEVANININNYELKHRVQAIQSDLYQAVQGNRYHLIVCNPPYVDEEDLSSMPQEYQHEPSLALGSGSDGLDLTRRILQQSADYLHEDGLLVLEVGNSCLALEKAFPDVPFTWVELEQGGHGLFVMTLAELQQYQSAFFRKCSLEEDISK